MVKKAAFLLMASVLSYGCASHTVHLEEIDEKQRAHAGAVLHELDLPDPTGHDSLYAMKARIKRIIPPIRNAAYKVCAELQREDLHCERAENAKIHFNYENHDINAYADQNNNIGIHLGLSETMGTDAEMAAVLAHEFSHIIFGHVDKKTMNQLGGAILGAGLAGVISAATGVDYGYLGQTSMAVGAHIGAHAYSPEMELEADRLAVYILEEAGYSPASMRDALVRLSRANDLLEMRGGSGGASSVGFLQTHPSDDRRIAHILSAIDDVEAGVDLRFE